MATLNADIPRSVGSGFGHGTMKHAAPRLARTPTSIVAVSFGAWPQGHLATGLPVPLKQSGGEQDSALSQSGELRVGQYSTPRAWKRLASAGSGVMPGSEVSLIRIGAHVLGGLTAFS